MNCNGFMVIMFVFYCVIFFFLFLVFFSIINQCLPFMAKKRVHFILHTTAELMERNQNSNPNPKPKP